MKKKYKMAGKPSVQEVTMRRQKIKKDRSRLKLEIFAALALGLVLTAIFARQLCPYDPYLQDYANALLPPSLSHPFGTDRFGRDMLSRVIMGSQVSIFSTLILVAVMAGVGTCVGVICGWAGGVTDNVIMRISDLCLAFPGLVFALAVAALLGGGIQNAVIALAVVSWPKYSRIARSQTMAVKGSDFIHASRMAGCTGIQIIWRHILPNILGQIIVTAMADIGTMMMELAGLSFLGLGAMPPVPEWGSMMSSGRSMIQTYPWVVITPGIGIFVCVAVFNLFGDGVRDYLDKRRQISRCPDV